MKIVELTDRFHFLLRWRPLGFKSSSYITSGGWVWILKYHWWHGGRSHSISDWLLNEAWLGARGGRDAGFLLPNNSLVFSHCWVQKLTESWCFRATNECGSDKLSDLVDDGNSWESSLPLLFVSVRYGTDIFCTSTCWFGRTTCIGSTNQIH